MKSLVKFGLPTLMGVWLLGAMFMVANKGFTTDAGGNTRLVTNLETDIDVPRELTTPENRPHSESPNWTFD